MPYRGIETGKDTLRICVKVEPRGADPFAVTIDVDDLAIEVREGDSAFVLGAGAIDALFVVEREPRCGFLTWFGVFARRPVGRFFAEAGADLYFSESFPMTQTEGAWVEDRISGILTAAVGADVVRTRRVVVNAQAGAGLELTKVAMPGPDGTHRDSRALPLGFVGSGGELRRGARTGLGMNLRTVVMGHFEHVDGWSHDHAAHTAGTDSGDMPVSPEIAAQGQFYISYRL